MRKERYDYAQIQRKEAADGVRGGAGHCGAGCGGLSEDDPRPDAQHGLPLCERPKEREKSLAVSYEKLAYAIHYQLIQLLQLDVFLRK